MGTSQIRAQKYFDKIITSCQDYTLWSKDDLNANKESIIKLMTEKNIRPIRIDFYRLQNGRLYVYKTRKDIWEFEKRGDKWCCINQGENAGFYCGICMISYYHRCTPKVLKWSDINGKKIADVNDESVQTPCAHACGEDKTRRELSALINTALPPPHPPPSSSPSFNELFDEISTEFRQSFPAIEENDTTLHECERSEFVEFTDNLSTPREYSASILSQASSRQTYFSIDNLLSDTISETSSLPFQSPIIHQSFAFHIAPESNAQSSPLVSTTSALLTPKIEPISDDYDQQAHSINSSLPDLESTGHSLFAIDRSQRKRTNESEEEDECKIIEIVSPLFKKPQVEEDGQENFQFDIPSSINLKTLCAKLDIEYSTAAYKLWAKISINKLSSKTTEKEIQCHFYKTKNPYECFAFLLTGSSADFYKIQNVINEALVKNLISRNISTEKIDKIIMASEVTDDHFGFMASWLPCKIGIYENRILKKFGNWNQQVKDERLIFVLSKVKGFYSIVLNV